MADNLKELFQKYNSINNIIRDLIDGYADNQLKKKTIGKEITGQDFSWASFSKNNDDLNLNKEEILKGIMSFLSKEKASKKIYHYGIRQEDFPDNFDSLFEFIGKNIDIDPKAFEEIKEDIRLYFKDIKPTDDFWNESVQNLIKKYMEAFDTKTIKQLEYPDAEVKKGIVIDSHGSVEVKEDINFRKLDVMNADAGENFLKENRWVRPWFNINLNTYEFVRNNDIMMNAITSEKELQFTRKQLKKVNSSRIDSSRISPEPGPEPEPTPPPEPQYDEYKIAVIRLNEDDSPTDDITYVDSLAEARTLINNGYNQTNSLYWVRIGEHVSLMRIGNRAFGDYSIPQPPLRRITIPSQVYYLDNSAFQYCTNLKYVEIASAGSFGTYVFGYCEALETIDLSTCRITSIPNGTFSSTSLSSIVWPNNIISIRDWAFAYTNFTSLTIPEGITSLTSYSFKNCSQLTEIILPSSITSINSNSFEDDANLRIIINKPENSIAGAPWGATNATVDWTG